MVMKTFTDFQQMHNEMVIFLKSLFKKGDKITIPDLKKNINIIINNKHFEDAIQLVLKQNIIININ